ncbi:hypothetical protein Trydic_g3797 [Trypoxylus dichotomus]
MAANVSDTEKWLHLWMKSTVSYYSTLRWVSASISHNITATKTLIFDTSSYIILKSTFTPTISLYDESRFDKENVQESSDPLLACKAQSWRDLRATVPGVGGHAFVEHLQLFRNLTSGGLLLLIAIASRNLDPLRRPSGQHCAKLGSITALLGEMDDPYVITAVLGA